MWTFQWLVEYFILGKETLHNITNLTNVQKNGLHSVTLSTQSAQSSYQIQRDVMVLVGSVRVTEGPRWDTESGLWSTPSLSASLHVRRTTSCFGARYWHRTWIMRCTIWTHFLGWSVYLWLHRLLPSKQVKSLRNRLPHRVRVSFWWGNLAQKYKQQQSDDMT